MKEKLFRMWRSGITMLLVLCMVVGLMAPAAFATQVSDADNDGVINYVSLGASNVNGYGIRGYLPGAVTEDPLAASKADLNVYGYLRAPDDAYPAQIAAALERATGKEVVLGQLAISSMRTEEVRYLLDDTYEPDAYMDWRFTGGQKWFEIAEPGGISALRNAYKTNIANADVITLDIGWNNFGVYAFNNIKTILADGNYWKAPDFSAILTEDEKTQYESIKAEVMQMLTENTDMASEDLMNKLELMADVLVYATIGACSNFDIVMEKIYELNDDANVVVINIQNLADDMIVEFEGVELALGDIYGELIDMVNMYRASASPYADKYLFANAGDVTTYLDEIQAWNGDPTTLGDNMKDCFDMYDDGLYVRSIVEYMMAGQALSGLFQGFRDMAASYGLEAFKNDSQYTYEFALDMQWLNGVDLGKLDLANPDTELEFYGAAVAKHLKNLRENNYGAYNYVFENLTNNLTAQKAQLEAQKANLPAGTLQTVIDQIDAGIAQLTQAIDIIVPTAKAEFEAKFTGVYNTYVNTLNYAYDVVATIVQYAASINTIEINANSLNGFNNAANNLMNYIADSFVNSATQKFYYELQKNGIQNTGVTADPVFNMDENLLADPAIKAIAVLAVRYELGNSFFVHPNEKGHDEITAAVLSALENNTSGDEFTEEKVKMYLEAAYDLILEYYDEAYAYAYGYAEQNGYIAEAVAAIDELIVALKDIESVPGTEAFQAEVADELEEIIETLEAAKVLLLEADVLDQASLDALVVLLNEAADAMSGLVDVLVQAGVDVNQLVIIPALKAAHDTLVNEVIPAVVENLKEAVKAGTEYLLEKLGDACEELVDVVIATVKKYATEADKALYDYLYNNPEEVIGFFKTYGPAIVDLVDDYGNEALSAVFYVLATYGEDIAAYIIENPETVMASITKWWDTYGDRIIAITQVYAEALGLCDAVREQVAELEAKLAAAIAELEALKAELEAKIAELEAKIGVEVEAVIAEIEAEIAKIEAAIAEVEAKIAEIKAELEEKKAELEAAIEAAIEAAEAKIEDAIALVLEMVKSELEAVIDEFEAAYIDAITDDYVIDTDSYYVALGDGTAASESYVDALAAELGIDYKNLADATLTISDVLATIETNAADIAAADLITIGYGNTSFTNDAVAQMMAALAGEAVKEYDWAAIVGEEAVPYIEMALAEVYAYLIEEGMGEEIDGVVVADVLMAAVEAYAYGTVSYAVNLPKAVAAVRAINPDAVVVIVGMHNPFRGTVLEYEGTVIDFSSIIDEFVDIANLYGTALCMVTGDAIFVEAPEVETGVSDQTIGVLDFLVAYIMDPTVLDPTANGDEYVKDQILNALNITVAGLLGDVDNNGIVNSRDAMLVSQYYAGIDVEINLSVADVDGNGYINSKDAMQIAQYYAGVITEFPAA